MTPNLHALAERFVLLDNFYCCAEVSADGWNWSTSGMGSEYTERNVPFNYSGRGRDYDFEGDDQRHSRSICSASPTWPALPAAISGTLWRKKA